MVAAVGGFLFGYDLSIISGAIIFLEKEFAAFCLTHLILKAVKFPQWYPRYLFAARAFWDSYTARLPPRLNSGIEHSTIRELGCLLLARIDGKSKIEYICDEVSRELVRQLARQILVGKETSLDLLISSIEERLYKIPDA